jgi:hypothetical protein
MQAWKRNFNVVVTFTNTHPLRRGGAQRVLSALQLEHLALMRSKGELFGNCAAVLGLRTAHAAQYHYRSYCKAKTATRKGVVLSTSLALEPTRNTVVKGRRADQPMGHR